MGKVLITAFEPYDRWDTNASWLALVELTKQLPERPQVMTRRYPVDYQQLKRRLADDLTPDIDCAILLGQAPGSARIRLEAVGLNLATLAADQPAAPLVTDGPLAYHTALPLDDWAAKLRAAGIPAQVSYHAGTYLCNAAMYLAHHFAALRRLPTRALFIHMPLAPSQIIASRDDLPVLPSPLVAAAVRMLLTEFA